MKLAAHRRRDQLDVVESIRARADIDRTRSYLEENARDLLPRFARLQAEAEAG